MSVTDTEFIERLNVAVLKLARESFGDDFVLLGDIPERINRRYSFMFRYIARGRKNGETHTLLVKIPHQSWMKTIEESVNSEQIRVEVKFEYDTLKSIAQVISDSGETQLCSLNPVGYFYDLNALATEEICLTMLKDRLTNFPIIFGSKTAWDDFSDKLRLAGKWLNTIHASFSQNKFIVLKTSGVFESVLEEISLLQEKKVSSLDSLRSKFRDLYNLVAEKEVPISSAHDDYHLGNIFVTDEGKVGVLDPNWKDDRPIYGDLSKLLIDPVTRKLQVVFQGMTFRPALRTKYERAIFLGYFSGNLSSESILWFYCALATLEKWNGNEEVLAVSSTRIPVFLRPFLERYVRGYFLKLVNSYLDRGIDTFVDQLR